jgi:glycerol kinase
MPFAWFQKYRPRGLGSWLNFDQVYPQPGWVEHDPLQIWDRTQIVLRGALDRAGIALNALSAVGITNQRETAVVWDRKTGRPYYNAIVWQDTRTDKIIASLAQEGGRIDSG